MRVLVKTQKTGGGWDITSQTPKGEQLAPARRVGRFPAPNAHLPDAGAGDFFQDADQRGRPIGEPMRLPAPIALGRKPDQLRIGGDGQRKRAGDRVEHVVA